MQRRRARGAAKVGRVDQTTAPPARGLGCAQHNLSALASAIGLGADDKDNDAIRTDLDVLTTQSNEFTTTEQAKEANKHERSPPNAQP
eukprot:tig00021489_g21697.t1